MFAQRLKTVHQIYPLSEKKNEPNQILDLISSNLRVTQM